MNRRNFLATCAMSGAIVRGASLAAETELEASGIPNIGAARFKSLVGSRFTLEGRSPRTVTLVEVRTVPTHPSLDQFTLIFRSDDDATSPEGLVWLAHLDTGRFPIRLDRGSDANLCSAAFNLLVQGQRLL